MLISTSGEGKRTYSEVECHFAVLLGDFGEEAGFLVCGQLVGKGGGGDESGEQWQQADEE